MLTMTGHVRAEHVSQMGTARLTVARAQTVLRRCLSRMVHTYLRVYQLGYIHNRDGIARSVVVSFAEARSLHWAWRRLGLFHF